MRSHSIINLDYKVKQAPPRNPMARMVGWFAVGTLSCAALVFIVVATTQGSRAADTRPQEAESQLTEQLLPSLALTHEADAEGEVQPEYEWREHTVAKGESLSGIFDKHNLGQTWRAILKLGKSAKPLSRMQPGDSIRFGVDETGKLAELRYPLNREKTLRIMRGGDGFISDTIEHPLERRTAAASGVIDHSLFLAGESAGLSHNLIMELAEIFGWSIDFALDIRSGDRFSVLYEELYREGQKVGTGAILAAEFVNQGKTRRAVRYTTQDKRHFYFTPTGRSLKRAFLRTPVHFARISSGFSRGRRHPVLNKIRAHKGVDYAARTGTPIRATGDGKVIFRGRKGGYGNTIILRHGSGYTTLYAHMNKFAKSAAPGKHVRQGQTIGYVGSTGLATGPHLHYEFRVNGVHKNPLTVRLPEASPIAKRLQQDFADQSEPLLDWLDAIGPSAIALNSNGTTHP